METWKRIVGLAHPYEISDLGNVRNRRKELVKQRMLGEYLYVSLVSKTFGRRAHSQREYVHRLVAKAFLPRGKNEYVVRHLNGDKTDNRACNLIWEEFRDDCYYNKEFNIVDHNPNKRRRFTPEQVRAIRREKEQTGISNNDLASKYGCWKGTIKSIVNRESWKDID